MTAEEEGHEFREVSLVYLRENLGEVVTGVSYKDHEVIITRNGKRVAALISMQAFEILQREVERREEEIDRRSLPLFTSLGEEIK